MDLSTTSQTEFTESKIDNGEKSGTNTSKSDIVQKIKKNLFKQERDRLWKVTKQIRQSKSLNDFLNNTASVIQSEFKADRVIIFRFEDDTNGQVITEAKALGWTPTLEQTMPVSCFGQRSAADYQTKGYVAIEDIANFKSTPYQKQLLEEFQVKASLAIPILLDPIFPEANALTNIWGLLVVQQCSQPRQWQEDEINLLERLSIELTRVVQPPLPRLQSEENLVATVEREMHRSMQRMLHEIRHSLKADRVLIYGFNPGT